MSMTAAHHNSKGGGAIAVIYSVKQSNSMPKTNQIQFMGKQPLMKELQRLVSFRCYNDVHGSGNSKKVADLHDICSIKHHGPTPNQLTQPSQEEDHVSYSDQCIKGINMFEPLFRAEQDIANGEEILVMKEIYSCLPTKRIIVSDKKSEQGINKAVLTSKGISNPANITGRNIWDNGKCVERNAKKALALIEQSEYKKYIKEEQMPSGKVYEDYILWLRRAMFKELKGDDEEKEDKETEEEDDDLNNEDVTDDEDDQDKMPATCFFPGFLAFSLWGPIMPPGFDDECKAHVFFSNHQSKEKKKNGRNAIRKEQAEEDDKSRASSVVSAGRGLTNKEHLLAASIAQQSSFHAAFQASRDKESRFFLLNERVKQAEKDVALWMPHCTSDMFEDPELYENHFAFKNLMDALNQKKKAQADMEAAMSKNERDEPNKYQAFVDQALGNHIETPVAKKAKTVGSSGKGSSESSTTSFAVTSVDVPGTVVTTDNNNNSPDVATLARMQEGAPRNPDGQTMCMTTEEYERRARSLD